MKEVSDVLGVSAKKPRSSVLQKLISEFLTSKESSLYLHLSIAEAHDNCMKKVDVTEMIERMLWKPLQP